ncbi:MAG: ABC transporter ATP-binding protein [Planctomycetes bacterium]|nr:ABC transporter ATP-binding protein [Planctomycetota bacterium]
MLQLNSVHKKHRGASGDIHALNNINCDIQAGEFVSIQGPSGCGKSTLLLCCGGLLAPQSGQISLDKTDIYALSTNKRATVRGEHIGFVFQQFHLVPYLNVRDNILLPSINCDSNTDNNQRADELLTAFALSDRALHKPQALSVGERQRAGLARALFHKPKLILADEPTGNLDPQNAQIVLDHLSKFAEAGGAVVMVTHDPDAAQRAHRQFQMNDGVLSE